MAYKSRQASNAEHKEFISQLIVYYADLYNLSKDDFVSGVTAPRIPPPSRASVTNWFTAINAPRPAMLGAVMQFLGPDFTKAIVDAEVIHYELPNPPVTRWDERQGPKTPSKPPVLEAGTSKLPPAVQAAAERSLPEFNQSDPTDSVNTELTYDPMAKLMNQATVALTEAHLELWKKNPAYQDGSTPSTKMVEDLISGLGSLSMAISAANPANTPAET